MGGGAWPFLVGGAICLVNSDNERDSSLLNRWRVLSLNFGFGVRRDQGWRCSSAVRPGCWGGGVFAAVSAVSEVSFLSDRRRAVGVWRRSPGGRLRSRVRHNSS